MGDNWDDEDFEIPVIAVSSLAPSNWDDEEEEVVKEEVVVSSAATLAAAAKKAEEAELKLINKMKYAQLENETPEEKKLRERRQIEEADNEITGDLFDGVEKPKTVLSLGGKSSLGSGGLASIPLSTKTDHSKFGQLVAKRFSDSTAFNIAAFYISLTDKISKKMSTETLDEVLAALNKVRADRKAEEPVKKISLKSTKKEIKAKEKKHNEIFGGSDTYDKYDDQYGDMEDNMF